MIRPFILMRSGINPKWDSDNIGENERPNRDNKREGDPIPYQFIDFALILKRLAEVPANKATYPDKVAFP